MIRTVFFGVLIFSLGVLPGANAMQDGAKQFDFVMPTVSSLSGVPTEAGAIVYDQETDKFHGYTGSDWSRLSNPRAHYASYSATGGTLTSPTVSATIDFATKVFDTDDAYSSGVYTVADAGIYLLRSRIRFSSQTWSTSDSLTLSIYRNSTKAKELATLKPGVAVAQVIDFGGAGLLSLAQGDTVNVKIEGTISANRTIDSSGSDFELTRLAE